MNTNHIPMKKHFFLILLAIVSAMSSFAADVELTTAEDLTTQYFIMAYSDNGTYKSPYWTKGNMQNVMSPAESALICNGKDYYYLMKAEQITYNGEKVYRVNISNGLHELFPNGIGGAAYLNSAGWCFFAGESEPTGKSHVYGQDGDGLGLWRITYTADKGFQFQCVGNDKYISYTMSNSSSADKYYWQCFAEGSLYDEITALRVSAPFLTHADLQAMLQNLVDDDIHIRCEDDARQVVRDAMKKAQDIVDAATTQDEILSAVVDLRAVACTFLNAITVSQGYQINVTPLIINASFPSDNAIAWEGTTPGFQTYGNAEFYSKSYDMHQTIPNMPEGTYMIRMQGYQRSDDSNDKALSNYLGGLLTQSDGYLYANNQQVAIAPIARDVQTTNSIGGTQYTVNGTDYWLPNSVSEASKFFKNGKYWNNLTIKLLSAGDLTIGLRSSVSSSKSWTCFDNFELYYQGEVGDVSDVTYLITNPSFETGTLDGWTAGKPSSVDGGRVDVGVKKNENEYATEGGDGDYLFNTWSYNDSYAYGTPEQFVEQTLTNMPPGEYHLSALASSNTYSSVNTPVELYGNNYVTSFVPQSKSSFKQTYEVTIYLSPSETKLTIGMRSCSWFRADNFRLMYYGMTDAYEQERRLSVVNSFEPIASQALDRSAYDAVLKEVRAALMVEDVTDEVIAAQNARLRKALMELIKTGTTETGQFDLTTMLTKTGIQRAQNIVSSTTLSQTLEDMPAGHYTFRANALYCPSSVAAASELYEAGTDDHPAQIYVIKKRAPVMNLFDGARHTPSGTTDIYGTVDGRCVPMTQSTSVNAFMKGQYPAVSEGDLESDGKLEVGFRITTPRKDDNWFIASNLKLYYGETPTITIDKSVDAGILTPVCLPFELETSESLQLYGVGSVLNGKAMLYPVSTVHAGDPCVVLSNEDIPDFSIPASKYNVSSQEAEVPLPWDGGILYSDVKNYTWTVTSVDTKTVTNAEDLDFVVCDPMNMDYAVNLENMQARRFIQLEDYVSTTSCHINNYNHTPPARRDEPNNVGIPVANLSATRYKLTLSENEDMSDAQTFTLRLVDGKMLYVPNLIPQRTYYYEAKAGDVVVGKGKFHTEGYLRMIFAPSVSNVRDLGGWKTADGQYIRYGLVYRGGELNGSHTATEGDVKRLRNLGIDAEIDLRSDDESKSGQSAFGFTIAGGTFYYANSTDWHLENLSSEVSYGHWRSEFNHILSNLRKGRSVYFHCIWGADRTGMLSWLLEGLLGVTQDQSNKNYELTTFSLAGYRDRHTQNEFFDYIKELKGKTLRDKFNTFFIDKLGISQEDIDEFRSIMLTSELSNSLKEVDTPLFIFDGNRGVVYDLSGRRVFTVSSSASTINTSRLKKGVYIIDGKKRVVR